jgi:AcrR family transcriptional regulator
MPKKFSDSEKEYIISRLKEEARKCIAAYGIKRTTVDELVKRVNIPKGTFYLFYASKELLLFDAINDLHNLLQEQVMKEITKLTEGITCDTLTEFFLKICRQVSDTGLFSVLMNEDMEYLMRRLPEDVVKKHLEQDDFSIEKFFTILPLKGDKNIEAFSGAFRAVFMTMLHKREIGEEVFDEALRLLIRGLVMQILEDEGK